MRWYNSRTCKGALQQLSQAHSSVTTLTTAASCLIFVLYMSSTTVGLSAVSADAETPSRELARISRSAVTDRREYGVVIDAGSSGSRVWIYRWPPSHSRWKLPKIEVVFNFKVQPGLAEYSRDIEGMSNVIRQLIEVAKQHVPEDIQPISPIYLLATAGQSS